MVVPCTCCVKQQHRHLCSQTSVSQRGVQRAVASSSAPASLALAHAPHEPSFTRQPSARPVSCGHHVSSPARTNEPPTRSLASSSVSAASATRSCSSRLDQDSIKARLDVMDCCSCDTQRHHMGGREPRGLLLLLLLLAWRAEDQKRPRQVQERESARGLLSLNRSSAVATRAAPISRALGSATWRFHSSRPTDPSKHRSHTHTLRRSARWTTSRRRLRAACGAPSP